MEPEFHTTSKTEESRIEAQKDEFFSDNQHDDKHVTKDELLKLTCEVKPRKLLVVLTADSSDTNAQSDRPWFLNPCRLFLSLFFFVSFPFLSLKSLARGVLRALTTDVRSGRQNARQMKHRWT
ncbi:unnamed protein product [Symbiodinium natans]|uniref:Uncharacterized protein n=1 Tax=Symbiodinium natans TaxID=878477 RepID=A0A812KGM3_9DINO|nr:unnamed protein product [Symbiodinium natans]